MTNHIEYQIKSFQEEPQKINVKISNSNALYNIHRTIIKQLHEQRQGNANCKTRSEVRGGGKKPWKQKGTGKARAGSIRSPLWRGGGVIFGPKTKIYKQKINKKEKHLAINNILYNRKDYTISLPSSFLTLDKPKTKYFLKKLEGLNINKDRKILIIMAEKNSDIYLATRNIRNIEIVAAKQLNSLAIIKSEYILIEKEAIAIINDKYYE